MKGLMNHWYGRHYREQMSLPNTYDYLEDMRGFDGNAVEHLLHTDIEHLDHQAVEEAMDSVTAEARVEAMKVIQDLAEHFAFEEDEAEHVEDYLVENQEARDNPHRLVLGASLASAGVDQIKDGAWRAYELDGRVHVEHREDGEWSQEGSIEWDICQYCAPAYARNRIDDIDRDHGDRGYDPFEQFEEDDPFRTDHYTPPSADDMGPNGGQFYEAGQYQIDHDNLVTTQQIDSIDFEHAEPLSVTVRMDNDGKMEVLEKE